MAAPSTGLKKKLTISPCIDSAGDIKVDSSKKPFEVMLNPDRYTNNFTITYNKEEPLGKSAGESKFSGYKPEIIGFDLVMDGTGVVNAGKKSPDVKTQVKQLKDIVYKYDDEGHEPHPVRLLWGSLIFFGRLETLQVEYTLFKPSGEPLRAKVTLAFVGFISKEEEALRANRKSADLTHIVEVKAGDTLPLLCHRIYKDCAYYTEVAKVNNLVNFRDLVPGMRLHFPPLR